MYKIKIVFILFSFIFLYNCSEKTIYSGKILNKDNFSYQNIKNREQLIEELGNPNYVDPIENKYFYYSEKTKFKNVFNYDVENRIILVFKFDDIDNITAINEYTLDDQNKISYSSDKIENNLVERGLLEKIFGGVSKSQIPNTSN